MALEEFLHSAKGKIRLKDTGLFNPKTKTVQLQTGIESGFLVLDIDNPYHENNKKLLALLHENDFFVYSSQYTLQDVLNGKCRYKVVYKYNGKHIPAKKTNKAIEIFYQKSKWASIAGQRDDGYEYKFSGKVSSIHFDVNDILESEVPFSLLGEEHEPKKVNATPDSEEDTPVIEEGDTVSIDEFKQIVGQFVDLPIISQKSDGLLTFDCLFPHAHTKKNHAYAFKNDGKYIARCQGEACLAEYKDLNKKIEEHYLNALYFDKVEGFDVDDRGVTIFQAGTGWGKTEKIAEEALVAVNENKKLLILLQNKEAINRLLGRIDEKSGGKKNQLEEFGKIFVYIAENKDENFQQNVKMANVIISHHYYFKNAGDLLTYYPSSWYILEQPNLEVIIDEAHSFIEMTSRLDLPIGGLYEVQSYNGKQILFANNKQLLRSDAKNNPSLQAKFGVLEAFVSDFGTVSLQKQYKLYNEVEYLDVFKEIRERLTLKYKFEEDHYKYFVYGNDNIQDIKANAIEDGSSAVDLLLDSAEYAVVGVNMGDDVPRKRIGEVDLTIYHSQHLSKVLTSPKKVILTTATINQYHEDIIARQCEYKKVVIEDKIEKIGKIVLLRSQSNKKAQIRRKVLDAVNQLNSKSLIFFPTIGKAKAMLYDYENCMLDDNGFYMIGQRKNATDYVDNVQRNVTLAGMESSVAKGSNLIEEIDIESKGFELIYFDNKPVSPQVIKKYVNEHGEIHDYENDYNIATFAQAIGRAMRKYKETLTIALNNIDDYTFDMIKSYLEEYTTSEIIVDDLNMTNIKLSISSYIRQHDMNELKQRFRNNDFFNKLYGGEEDENSPTNW